MNIIAMAIALYAASFMFAADERDKFIEYIRLVPQEKQLPSPTVTPSPSSDDDKPLKELPFTQAPVTGGKLPAPVKLSAKDLQTLWEELADADAAKAFRAQTRLVAGAGDSLPWLAEKARAFPAPDLTQLEEFVKNLDSNEFDVRHKAVDELVKIGSSDGAAVRKALAKEMPSFEARLLAKEVLEKLAKPSPEYLREIRTLELIEQIGTPAARTVLEKLAGEKGVHQEEAKASLERLARRGVGK